MIFADEAAADDIKEPLRKGNFERAPALRKGRPYRGTALFFFKLSRTGGGRRDFATTHSGAIRSYS